MHKTIQVSAARASGAHTSTEINASGYASARFYLVSSPGASGGTVQPGIFALDKTSGAWVLIPGAQFAATATSACTTLTISPNVTAVANVAVAQPLADTLRAVSTVATSTVTFSLSVDLIR